MALPPGVDGVPAGQGGPGGRAACRSAAAAKKKTGANPVATLFHHGLGRSTIAFWVTSFMGLLLVYGLNTWLPQIMKSAGYELGAALALLLVLNAGGVLGLLIAGRVADRIGNRRSTIAWFAAAALFLALLSVKLPGVGIYVSVLLAGVFVFSAQVLVYAYVGHVYPAVGARHGDGRGERGRPARRDLRSADRRVAVDGGPGIPVGLLHLRVVAAIGAVSSRW